MCLDTFIGLTGAQFFQDIDIKTDVPTLHSDNQAALATVMSEVPHHCASISQYITTSFAMSTTSPTLQSTISLPKINLQMCSQRHYIPPRQGGCSCGSGRF